MKLVVKRIPQIRRVDTEKIDAEIHEFMDYIMDLIKDEPFEVQLAIRHSAFGLATEWMLKLEITE